MPKTNRSTLNSNATVGPKRPKKSTAASRRKADEARRKADTSGMYSEEEPEGATADNLPPRIPQPQRKARRLTKSVPEIDEEDGSDGE